MNCIMSGIGLRGLSYGNRLDRLNLFFLERRQARDEVIQFFENGQGEF